MELKTLNKIKLDEKLKAQVILCANNNEKKVLTLSKKLNHGNTRHLKRCDDIVRLAVVLKAAEKTYEKYVSKGIPESIFVNTFDDVRIWCKNNSNKGLENYGWLKNHVKLELFKLGRLQFQMFTATRNASKIPNVPFKCGDKLLYVHIPQGEKLNFESCVSSIQEANEFFKTYFPEYNYKYFFCESWLLYEGNQNFMKSNSNILKFAGLFDIHSNFDSESQTYERIFNINKVPQLKSDIANLPETTSLQKAAKAYALSGRKFGIGAGTIKKEFIE
ncbi:MAG: acyltransferase domain-containing protein [Ruminococcus sp.]|nr:acyltransferase domain-containing protein [Ruminococcus sp.]